MLKFLIKMYVGPCEVAQVATRLRNLGFCEVLEGTEHVYWQHAGDSATTVQDDANYCIQQLYTHSNFKPILAIPCLDRHAQSN